MQLQGFGDRFQGFGDSDVGDFIGFYISQGAFGDSDIPTAFIYVNELLYMSTRIWWFRYSKDLMGDSDVPRIWW